MVTAETGVKVPACGPDQAVSGLAQALSTLHDRPELRQRLGVAAKEFARRECLTPGDLWSDLGSAPERLRRRCVV